jgi:hypothetical protein
MADEQNELTVQQVAAMLEIAPKRLSAALYSCMPQAILARCPVVAGRRRIPRDLIPSIRRILLDRGWLGTEIYCR